MLFEYGATAVGLLRPAAFGGWGGGVGGWGAGFGFGFGVETGGDFLGVALVVEGEEAVEDFAAGGGGKGVAEALFGFVEAVAQGGPVVGREVEPAVGGGDGDVELAVEGAEFGDVRRSFGGVVETII